MPRVLVEVSVHATESLAKVKLACLNLFPDLAITEEDDRLLGESSSLAKLRELIRNQHIRDSVREVLLRNRQGTRTSFRLNKQAAYVGRVNVSLGSPLGDIHVRIEDPDLDALIDEVAESTVGRRLTRTRDRTEGT